MTKRLPVKWKGYHVFWKVRKCNEKRVTYPDYIWLDSELIAHRGFCDECEAIEEETDINYSSCPTSFDCLDENCVRRHLIEEIIEVVDALNEKLDEISFGRNLNRVFIERFDY